MKDEKFSARAALSGYLVWAGIWLAIGIFYAWLQFARPNSSGWKACVLVFPLGILCCIWLRGFDLRIEGDELTYRDGMYRTQRGRVSRVVGFQGAWIEWERLPGFIKVPRLLITFEGGDSIVINTKPFSRPALAEFRRRVKPSSESASPE